MILSEPAHQQHRTKDENRQDGQRARGGLDVVRYARPIRSPQVPDSGVDADPHRDPADVHQEEGAQRIVRDPGQDIDDRAERGEGEARAEDGQQSVAGEGDAGPGDAILIEVEALIKKNAKE